MLKGSNLGQKPGWLLHSRRIPPSHVLVVAHVVLYASDAWPSATMMQCQILEVGRYDPLTFLSNSNTTYLICIMSKIVRSVQRKTHSRCAGMYENLVSRCPSINTSGQGAPAEGPDISSWSASSDRLRRYLAHLSMQSFTSRRKCITPTRSCSAGPP